MQRARTVRWAAPLATAVFVIGVWVLVSELARPMWLPTIPSVFRELSHLLASGAFSFLGETALTLGIGLLVTFVGSAVIAGLMAGSETAEDALLPFVNGFLSTPHIALIPVFTFIWGNGEVTRIVTTVSFALSPVILTWLAALKEVRPDLMEMGSSFGAGPVAKLRYIRLPGSISAIIAGLRIGVMQGVKGVASAEVIIGVVGIGKLITTASNTFNMAQLYAVVLIIIALSVLVYLVLMRFERGATRWNS